MAQRWRQWAVAVTWLDLTVVMIMAVCVWWGRRRNEGGRGGGGGSTRCVSLACPVLLFKRLANGSKQVDLHCLIQTH